MTESTDRPRDAGTNEESEPLRQPAQEIVDPRAEHPEPDAPDVEISGAREPRADTERDATVRRADHPPSGLPPDEAAAFSGEQQRVFTDSYHAALEEFGDEERALDVARAAARGTPGDR
jgi:hypothetical protein